MNRFEEIRQVFNSLPWHDSALLKTSLATAPGNRSSFSVEVDFVVPYQGFHRWMVMWPEPSLVNLDLDVDWIRVCGAMISSANCRDNSRLLLRIQDTSGAYSPQLLHFSVSMIPEGGSIDVVAPEFILESSGKPAE